MEYPPLEQIYDLSTDDLRTLQQLLRNNSVGHEQLFEAVTLQIEQRKAVQYFSQLCKADNPYARRAAAFNQQFLKLAAETIAKNHNAKTQGISQCEIEPLPIYEQPKQELVAQKQIQQKFDQGRATHSQNQRMSTQLTNPKQSQNHQNPPSDTLSQTTESSLKTSVQQLDTHRTSAQLKLNLGWKKGQKDKMKEKIKNILANTKISEDAVIKKSQAIGIGVKIMAVAQKKDQRGGEYSEMDATGNNKISNSRKSIDSDINSQKDIKLQHNKKSMKEVREENRSKDVTKKQTQSKVNRQKKKAIVKLPKINQYKDLLQMVKQQQEQKKLKLTRQSSNNEKLPHIESRIENQFQQITIKQQNKNQEKYQPTQNNHIQIKQSYTQHKNQLQGSTSIKQQHISQNIPNQNNVNVHLRVHEQIIIPKQPNIDEIINKKQNTESTNIEHKKSSEQTNLMQNLSSTKIEIKILKTTSPQETPPKQQKNQITQKQTTQSTNDINQPHIPNTNTNHPPNSTNSTYLPLSLQQPITNNNPDPTDKMQTKILIEQIEKQQENQYHFFREKYQEDRLQEKYNMQIDGNKIGQFEIQQNNQHMINIIDESRQTIPKKCYSEQYWQHIREQAELQIKRFKQQKQYVERKQKQISETSIRNQSIQELEEQEENDEEQRNSFQMKQEPLIMDKEIAQKQEQLNKIKKQMMKKINTKIPPAAPIPKILRQKPQFDYFSIYPTFNHIFSVMYLKPILQALNQIPNIMRDIKTLFVTHMEHFSNRSNFKPAIFLPFDHNGALLLNDPKQLIAHAQQTYIDLQVMIERVQIFNDNLHGQFTNSTNDLYYRVVKTKQQVYDIITTSFLRKKGWKQLPHGCSLKSSWNLFWSWSKPDIDINRLLIWQKINHFPFNKNLSRKDLLYKNLDLFRRSYKISMNFLPITFNLPKQFSQLSAKFHEEEVINKNENYWIMKPIGKSRGRGIKIVTSLSELNYTDNIVVQKYIANPMLIDGYKFDMRIYVLVTSFHPLQAFVYREGFARLSTQKYSLDAHSIKNTFIHLTNFAINRNNTSSNTIFAGGSKISLKTLKDKITKMGYSFHRIWIQIHDIIVKSLLGCSVSVPSFPTAFELFGYDIMVDQMCNCHLIEINSSPSLERSYMIDEIVKQNLIDDILNIVDPPDFDKKQLLDVLTDRINSMTNKKKISQQDDLIHLARILKYKPMRKLGEIPEKIGLFEMVAPCETSVELEKVVKAKSGANNPLNID